MQVVACNFPQPDDIIKVDFESLPRTDEHDTQRPQHARRRRAAAMMAPIIILGVITVFVVWDTSEGN
ncbi:MAG TPA: hypothetical protein VN775_02735 [Opitutaceae bacterium]|nr:hypothetical protein [Opitutaceae bacterium]